MLVADDLHVELDGHRVLKGVSMNAGPGKVVGLLGPNGAGKSTLLRALAGIEIPVAGAALLDGVDVGTLSGETRARRIAYLPQSSEVHWPLSVFNLVALGRLPHRRVFASLDSSDQAAIAGALERTEIEDLQDRSVGSLSGGERMRALIARMLAVGADALLVDEPVAGLDPYYQIQFMDLFRTEAEEGRIVLLVLHDLALAARYCDELVLLAEGGVAGAGAPGEVLSSAALEDVYGVEGLHGNHEGEAYVLPWRRKSR